MELNPPDQYRKYQSFEALKHRAELPDARPRLKALRERLPKLDLPEYRKSIVAAACDEALGLVKPDPFAPFTIHSNVQEEISRLADEELPRYLFYRFRYEMFPQRRRLDDYPPCLQIEPTSVCNYRCVFCYQTDEAFHAKGTNYQGAMPLDLFKKVVDQAQGNIEAVTIASRGEPTLSPHIKEMLAYLSGKFLGLKMNTNASMLDEAKCHAILQAGVNTLVFSADAAAEPAYGQLRVGGKLDRVLANVRRFQEVRRKHYPDSRIITRVSGVKVPGTPGLEDMQKVWGDLADQVAFVNFNPWNNTYDRPVNDIVDPCSELWLRMFVWWDGTVNPCENDYRSTLTVGNAKEKGVSEIWKSDKYMGIREQHLKKSRSKCFPCDRCPVV
jgi:radical SAM protein with 4Fe4S-binding SPASM domain